MKKRSGKWLICGVLALAMAAGIAAYFLWGRPQTTASDESQGTGFRPALDAQTECSITVAGHYDNFEALEAEFNLFSQYYPKVEMKYVKLDNYKGAIGTAVNSEEAPDIYFVFPSMTTGSPEFQPVLDAAENLADEKLGLDLSCVRSGILFKDAAGKVPYVPIYSETFGMMVNEDIFEKEKIAIPKTYGQLLTACEALKKAGYAGPVLGYAKDNFMIYPLYYPYFCAQIQNSEKAVSELNALEKPAGEYMRSTLELVADFMGHGYVDLEECGKLEKDYEPVILRFFEGDVPMMMAKAGTVSGTQKREGKSEAFTAHPFKYSFRPVPSTEEGGYFLETVSMGFAVNKNSKNLSMANEFMRFLVRAEELNRMAHAKRMVTTSNDMSMDAVYAAFGELDVKRMINTAELGLKEAPDRQVRLAVDTILSGSMTVDEAVEAFGTLE